MQTQAFPQKVLIVDDDAIMLTLIGGLLDDLGVSLSETAESAEHAMAALEQGDFELVFLDIEMAGMNGLELLKRIRVGDTGAPRQTRVVVVSSHTENPVLGTAIALDVNGILSKPIDGKRLQAKLSSVMAEPFRPRPSVGYEVINTDVITTTEGALPSPEVDEGLSLDELSADCELAAPVYSRSGELLLPTGTVLSETAIARLQEIRAFLRSERVLVKGL